MVAAIEQIQRELAALETTAVAIAQECRRLYASYLEALGQATYQQLILACYHLCTQAYADLFLELSLEQRQSLQTELKQLSRQLRDVIRECLQPLDALVQNQTQIDPLELDQQQQQLEATLAQELHLTSRASNQILQEHGLLTAAQIEIAMKVATKEDKMGSGRVSNPYPNLVTLIIESSEAEETSSTTIAAIFLQLAEIEFADPTVMAWRNQIRQLTGQLQELLQRYDSKREELLIARAEAAWRASWVKD